MLKKEKSVSRSKQSNPNSSLNNDLEYEGIILNNIDKIKTEYTIPRLNSRLKEEDSPKNKTELQNQASTPVSSVLRNRPTRIETTKELLSKPHEKLHELTSELEDSKPMLKNIVTEEAQQTIQSKLNNNFE